jgi:surfeit locus 1 family protein
MSILATLPKLLNRKWWLSTLVIIIGVYFLIQLGFWQLDRLQQRRDFNARVAERWQQEPFDVNNNAIPDDLSTLEYRRVQVTGEFDYNNQILLSSQTRNQAPGSVIVTPLVLDDQRAILVARGWLPSGEDDPEQWSKYDEAVDAEIVGLIQESQLLPNGSAPTPPTEPQQEWFQLNIDAIQPQMPYELLPVFILQLPEDGRTVNDLPLREEPLVLDEGSHFSYAMQWFMFAMILGVGYIFFVRSQELHEQHIAGTLQDDATPATGGEPDRTTMSHREGHA